MRDEQGSRFGAIRMAALENNNIESLDIVITGDYPSFDEDAFKLELSKLFFRLDTSRINLKFVVPVPVLLLTVLPPGSVAVHINCRLVFWPYSTDVSQQDDEDRIVSFVRLAIERNWPGSENMLIVTSQIQNNVATGS